MVFQRMAKTAIAARSPKAAAALLTLAGLAAAFGAASCCALPLLLAAAGMSAAWLGGIALMAEPHRDILLAIGALCLSGGGILLWRQQLRAAGCGRNGACTPAAIRVLNLVALLIGFGLLWAGYSYV
jgi:mercuric ion transport protein